MTRQSRCLYTSKILLSAPSVFACITIEHLFPVSSYGDTYSVVVSCSWGEIADDQYILLQCLSFSEKADDTFFPVGVVHPFNTCRFKVELVQSRFTSVENVQMFQPDLNVLMLWKLQEMPVQTVFMCPFPALPELASHK